MDNSDVLQRNAAGELEVRVVNGTEKADAPANYDDVFTVNSEGKRALRVVGAGGGGGTGTVTSVNSVQPVDGNVEITGDNITATVGEEEETITQHLTTLKNDEAELGEQVQENQSDINTLKNQQYPFPTESDYTFIANTYGQSNLVSLYLTATADASGATAIPDGTYCFYMYTKNNFGDSEGAKKHAQIKFVVKDGAVVEMLDESSYAAVVYTPFLAPEYYKSAGVVVDNLPNSTPGWLANCQIHTVYCGIRNNKFYFFIDPSASDQYGILEIKNDNDTMSGIGFSPIKNLETGAELICVGSLETSLPSDCPLDYVVNGTTSPYTTVFNVSGLPTQSTLNIGGNLGVITITLANFYAREYLISGRSASFGRFVYKIRGDASHATRLNIGAGGNIKLYSLEPGLIAIDNTDGDITSLIVSYYGVTSGGINYNIINTLPNTAIPIPIYFEPGRMAQYSVMPEVDIWNFGQIVQYVGETDNNYTHGYVYKTTGEYQAASTSLDFGPLIDISTGTEIPDNTVSFVDGALNWIVNMLLENDLSLELLNSTWAFNPSQNIIEINYDDSTGYGEISLYNEDPILITFTTPPETKVKWVASNYTETSPSIKNGAWERIDMQPSTLPAQTGNAGKFLTTDGAKASWATIPSVGAATLLYYDSTQAPDHSHAMSGVSLDGYGLAGYEVYSNGYVRQWGQDSTSTGATSVTLPISYTAASTISMSFFVSVTEVAAAPTGQISAIPVAANQFQVNKPSAICNWETGGYITLS